MTWNIEFLKEAEKDLNDLDGSVKKQVLKGIQKVSQNPFVTKGSGGLGAVPPPLRTQCGFTLQKR